MIRFLASDSFAGSVLGLFQAWPYSLSPGVHIFRFLCASFRVFYPETGVFFFKFLFIPKYSAVKCMLMFSRNSELEFSGFLPPWCLVSYPFLPDMYTLISSCILSVKLSKCVSRASFKLLIMLVLVGVRQLGEISKPETIPAHLSRCT